MRRKNSASQRISVKKKSLLVALFSHHRERKRTQRKRSFEGPGTPLRPPRSLSFHAEVSEKSSARGPLPLRIRTLSLHLRLILSSKKTLPMTQPWVFPSTSTSGCHFPKEYAPRRPTSPPQLLSVVVKDWSLGCVRNMALPEKSNLSLSNFLSTMETSNPQKEAFRLL